MLYKSVISLVLATSSLVWADNDTKTKTAKLKDTTTSINPCSQRTTLREATAIQQLIACETLAGEIIITGNEVVALDLSQVEEITGDVSIRNSPSIISLNLNRLETISGSLVLNNNTQLTSIDLTSLTDADNLQFISLPAFSTLNLNQGVRTAGRVVLSDTALENLNGLAAFDTIDYMNINNNKNMINVAFSNLETVKDSLIISFNNDDAIVNLDSLKWASNLTVQDVAELSAQNLTAVNGSLQISYNGFESVNLTKLTNVGSSLQIFANDALISLDLHRLEEIGGELSMFNNTELEDAQDSFESLERVRGAVSISGNLVNFSMPSLNRVNGDFELRSTSEDLDCSEFDELHDEGNIEGHNYVCSHAEQLETSTAQATSDATTGSSDTSPDKESAGERLFVPTIFAAGIVAGFFFAIM